MRLLGKVGGGGRGGGWLVGWELIWWNFGGGVGSLLTGDLWWVWAGEVGGRRRRRRRRRRRGGGVLMVLGELSVRER